MPARAPIIVRAGEEVSRRVFGGWIVRAGASFALCVTIAACATSYSPRPAPPAVPVVPPAGTIYGTASWYGPGFNGHRTSSGEIYNQEDLTAASMLYPLGSRVIVTNLQNRRSVEVTINDRGPFKKGRKIDLSHKAARMIGMIGPGTAEVRIDLLSAPPNSSPVGAPPRYYVQVGSFASSANATRLRTELAAYYPDVMIDRIAAGEHHFYRVRMGAFSSRYAAERRANASARFGLPIVITSE